MNSCLTISTAVFLGLLPGDLKPIEVGFGDFAARSLEAARLLPQPDATDLRVGKEARIDLAAELEARLRKRYDDAKPDGMKSFADVLARFGPTQAGQRLGQRATGDLLAQVEHDASSVWRDVREYLPQLVQSDLLYVDDWDPDDDESNDGLLCVAPWEIKASPSRGVFWNAVKGDRDVCQGAAMIYADLASLKRMEFDYASYKKQVGNQYVQIYPVADSYLIGKDPAGNEFSSMRVFFETHIPFPFGNAEGELLVYDHFTDGGKLLSEVYSKSSDFHWLAGRDTLLPVTTSQGTFVGVLYVRELGFDVSGVPDGVSDRMKGIRSALGNKKRIAERIYADSRTNAVWVVGKLPRPPVTGGK